MARLPSPNRPIKFDALEPIHAVPSGKPLDVFSHVWWLSFLFARY
jgi:hypothetical protein